MSHFIWNGERHGNSFIKQIFTDTSLLKNNSINKDQEIIDYKLSFWKDIDFLKSCPTLNGIAVSTQHTPSTLVVLHARSNNQPRRL